jgi:molybdopterin-guanine dinucleotide biosynthesis protein A
VAVAGIVLAGGTSSRMGRDKAWLEWQGTSLLGRTCATLAVAVDGPVIVVRSAGQSLPALPADVRVVDDPRPRLGPLQGMAAGLAAVRPAADVAFVAATDLPLLAPVVVRCIVAALLEPGDAAARTGRAGGSSRSDRSSRSVEVALPVVSGEWQPLAAAYRTDLALAAEADVAAGLLSVRRFAAARRVRLLTDADLLADAVVVASDPGLISFVNVNDEQQLAHARERHRG